MEAVREVYGESHDRATLLGAELGTQGSFVQKSLAAKF